MILKGAKIQKFVEKNSCSGKGLVNTLSLKSRNFYKISLKTIIFLWKMMSFPSLANRGLLYAVEVQADFIDIGVPQDYFKFCTWIETGKLNAL